MNRYGEDYYVLMKDYMLAYNVVRASYNRKYAEDLGYKFLFEKNTDTEVIFKELENGEMLEICFRGVDKVKDLFGFCFKFSKIRVRDVKIHKGFFSKFLSILLDLKGVIDTNKYKKYRVIGYSLGGALARLFVWYLYLKKEENKRDGIKNNRKKIDLIVFGSPRVGDKKFEECVEGITNKYISFIHFFDFVTKLPPKIFNFVDGGKNIYKFKNNKGFFLFGHWHYKNLIDEKLFFEFKEG